MTLQVVAYYGCDVMLPCGAGVYLYNPILLMSQWPTTATVPNPDRAL